MSPRNSFSSSGSNEQAWDSRGSDNELRSLQSPSPAQRDDERDSNTMTPQAGFHSPNGQLPSSSNHLRRSLVLRLDRERREHCETLDQSFRQVDNVTEDVFLPSDGDLLEALDLGGSSHRPLQLRLRPVASHDMDEFCATCGGSTVLFHTPRQRRSSVPRQDQRQPVPLPCQCHANVNETTSQEEPFSSYGPRLSFVHMASPSDNGQIHLAVSDRNETHQLQETLLQLSLLDDDDDDDNAPTESAGLNQNHASAFRQNVILQPKAINRCHSAPAYVSGSLADADSLTHHGQDSLEREPTTCLSAPHPPGLLKLSTTSSASSSPEDLQTSICLKGAPSISNATATMRHRPRNTAFSSVSPQVRTNLQTSMPQPSKDTSKIPPIPTMETPESTRPVLRTIALAPKSTTEAGHGGDAVAMLLDNDGLSIPPPPPPPLPTLAPMLEGTSFDDNES